MSSLTRRKFVKTTCLALVGADARTARASASQTLTKLDVILFPSVAAAAVYVGLDRGDYARAGLDVGIAETPDSAFLMGNLVNGRFQIAVALADNFVAYQQGQHATAHLPGRDVSMIMGLTKSSATLVARPDFTTIESLRSRKLGVDAPGTGLAFVLYRMLEDAGLTRDDYTVLRAGSTQERARALIRGEIDATMLSPEFARQAQASGMRALADSKALFPSYMGATVAIERNWATRNRSAVEAFICATLAATQWLMRAENQPALTELLSRHLQIPPEQLRQALSELIEGHSLIRDGRVDLSDLGAVLALRARYGRPAQPLAAPGHFLDLKYLDSVTKYSAMHVSSMRSR
jgi:ABC-type nitrate/sulfonate/bicarbonate transport system substrate-binding protein